MGISKRRNSAGSDEFHSRRRAFFEHWSFLEGRIQEYLLHPSAVLAESCFFLLQQQAWLMGSFLEFVAFELRVAPGNAMEPLRVVDTLTREAGLPVGEARMLKQFLEYRHLARRPIELLSAQDILTEGAVKADRQFLEVLFPLLAEIVAE